MSNNLPGSVSSSQTLPDPEARTVPRDKVQAARFSPQELKEIEAAAKREGKSPSTWLRDVALQAARPAPDTAELVLAEVAATRYMLLNLFHASATAMQQKSILTPPSASSQMPGFPQAQGERMDGSVAIDRALKRGG